MVIPVWDEEMFYSDVRRLLREIVKIRQDTGYSADQVLMAMLVEATLEKNKTDSPMWNL